MGGNFLLGLSAIARSIALHLIVLWKHPFFWGLGVGILLAALLSCLVITGNPANVCDLLLSKDSSAKKSSKNKHKKDNLIFNMDRFHFIKKMIQLFFSILILLFSVLFLSALSFFACT